MNLLSVAVSNLRYRPLSSLFNITVLALGVAMIITLLHVSQQLEQRFAKDLKGVDMVVGAKGSPMQLILSAVFHLDVPTGNILLSDAESIKRHPLVKSTIPVALGDNYQGFRIVGTTADYVAHYQVEFAEGKIFSKPMHAVVGSQVAAAQKLKLGDRVTGAHGLTSGDDSHEDMPYEIVGVLKPTGGVIDRLVLTPVESVWHVHGDTAAAHEKDDHAHHKHDHKNEEAAKHQQREITALLVKYASPAAAVTLPRQVNSSSALQAASPAFELARLLKMMGAGSDAIRWFGMLLVIIAAVGFFVSLFNAINDRRYDMVLMRCLGATRGKLFSLVLLEGLMLGVAGIVLGLLLARGLLYLAVWWIAQSRHIILEAVSLHPYEIHVVLFALAITVAAAIIPAILAYRVNAAAVLARGQ
jgi:putative ABC transport system permease protein